MHCRDSSREGDYATGCSIYKNFQSRTLPFHKNGQNTFWLHQQHQKCAISVLWPFTNYNFPMKHHVYLCFRTALINANFDAN